MIVETFDITTIWNKSGKPATVRIEWGDQGRIYFSLAAVRDLKLKEGMRIAFRTYSADPDIIYFFEQATGLVLNQQEKRKTGISLAIYCRPLAKKLLEHFNLKKFKARSFTLKPEKVKMPGTNCEAWMIQKTNVHKPINWRKKS